MQKFRLSFNIGRRKRNSYLKTFIMGENNTESKRTPVAFMIIPHDFYCYLHILKLQFKTLKAFVSSPPISGVYLLSIKSMFFPISK